MVSTRKVELMEEITKRNLSLKEQNVTKTEVTLIANGVMFSRLLGSTLYYAIVSFDLEMIQVKFYMELSDDLFVRFSENLAKLQK